MISLTYPEPDTTRRLLDSLADAPHSYPEVGATRDESEIVRLSPRYNVDRYSTVVAHGDSGFEASKEAIRRWAPFAIPWIRVVAQSEPRVGTRVAVITRVVGVWWTNVSRVVYTVDEPNRFGFAYGTLDHHAESGEELFLVELNPETEEVTYSVLAFSRPRHFLARLGYPLSRMTQRRFGRETREAMRREANRSG